MTKRSLGDTEDLARVTTSSRLFNVGYNPMGTARRAAAVLGTA